jgi:hypothetical protein
MYLCIQILLSIISLTLFTKFKHPQKFDIVRKRQDKIKNI